MSVSSMSDDELLEKIRLEEERLVFSDFSTLLAHDIGLALLEHGRSEGLPIAIDVSRNDQCLFHAALPGSAIDNAEWIVRKNRVVRRFGHSSLYMGVLCRLSGKTLEKKFLLPKNVYAPHGGAFPVRVGQCGVVGIVSVSGLAQIDDHELVVTMLEKFMETQRKVLRENSSLSH